MRTDWLTRLRYPAREDIAALAVSAAVLSGSMVLFEPAPTDALMLALVVLLPILGVVRLGHFTLICGLLLLITVCLSLALTPLSATIGSAVKHQLVTLFLVLGAIVVAAYIAADPVARFERIMRCYIAACLFATVCGLIGYFHILPGTYELFTEYGRARGTFKDPNVYGAALTPAIAYLAWNILRSPIRQAGLSSAILLVFAVGLVLSFSRGAWIATTLAVVTVGVISATRGRRREDVRRLMVFLGVGVLGISIAVTGLLQVEKVRDLLTERFSLSQQYDEGPDGRFGGQVKALELIAENPFGIGTHTFRARHHHEQAHNVYLTIMMDAGWLGGLTFIAAIVLSIGVGLYRATFNSALQGPILVCAATVFALSFEGIVIDLDHWRHYFLFLGCLWGLTDARLPAVVTTRRSYDPPPKSAEIASYA